MTTEKIKLSYRVGDSANEPNTIIISISNTGLTVEKDRERLEKLVQKLGVELYACANNIDLENVNYKINGK